MAQAVDDSTLWFRMHIGAVDVANPPKPGPGAVVVKWPTLGELVGLDAEWKVNEDFVFIPNGYGVARRYGAAKAAETLNIEVFSAARGFPGSVDRLVEIAMTTMMAMPPYDKAPDASRLGEVAVLSTDPAHRRLIWTFRGLCLSVETSAGGDETIAVARRLQQFVARHVVEESVAAKARPKLALPSKDLMVATGGTIEVKPTTGNAALMIAAHPDNLAVLVTTQTPQLLTFQGRMTGRTQFSIVLADPATLMADASTITVVSQ